MMQQLYRTTWLFLLMFSVFCSQAKAQSTNGRIIGAEITYKSLGGNDYEITLNAYRDCASTRDLDNQYFINYTSVATPPFTGSLAVNLVNKEEASQFCPGQASFCSGGTLPGYKRYVYKGTVTLPYKSRWTFSWGLGNRSASLTTINNPTQTLYVESMLNNFAVAVNNSPTFSSEPQALVCTNNAISFNLGATQPDTGHVLRYSLVSPRTGSTSVLTYKTGYSATQFLTSSTTIAVNATTGDISLNPSANNEVSCTALKVDEYFNGELIGSVVRDFQIATRDCDNALPSLTGINGQNNFSMSVCAGTSVNFSVSGTDNDVNQSVTLSWNNGITGASFASSGNTGTFSWTPTSSNIGVNTFIVTAKDNACPVPGTQNHTFSIKVVPTPIVKLGNDTTIGCNTTLTLAPILTSGTAPFTYMWSPGGETTPTVQKSVGSYTVLVTDSNGCTAADNIIIKKGIIPDFKSNGDSACVGVPVKFTDLSSSSVASITNWAWRFGDGGTSTTKNPTHAYANPGLYTVRLIVKDATACADTIVKQVKVCKIPTANFNYLDSCQNKPLSIMGIQEADPTACPITTWKLTDDKSNSLTNTTGAFILNYADSGTVNVTLTVFNANGCSSSITKAIYINPRPFVNIVDTSYFFKCNQPDSTVDLQAYARPISKPYKIAWSNGQQIDDTSGTVKDSIVISQTGFYTATVTDVLGCTCVDNITVNKPLTAGFINSNYCEANQTVQFTNITESNWGVKSYQWHFGDGATSSLANPSHLYPLPALGSGTSYSVKLFVTDSTDCLDSIKHQVIIALPTTTYNITSPDTICFGDSISYAGPQGQYVNSWIWKFTDTDSITVTNAAQSNGKYAFNQAGCFNVRLRLVYNDNGTGACQKIYPTKKICVRNPFTVSIDKAGTCANSPTQFTGTKTSGDYTVTNWNWEFWFAPDNATPATMLGSSTQQNPVFTFRRKGIITAKLRATDKKGCKAYTESTFNMNDVAKPSFDNEGFCVGKAIHFTIKTAVDTFENIATYKYIFGDGNQLPSSSGDVYHTYSNTGTYNVVLVAYSQDGCADSSVTALTILNAPTPIIKSDTVCNNIATSFQGSLLVPDATATYFWLFGDGDTANTQNPTHLYTNAGIFEAKLIVTSASGCRDTTTQSVVVKRNPVANFGVGSADLIANRPVVFNDNSSFTVKWIWTFDNNGPKFTTQNPDSADATHTYPKAATDAGNIHTVTLVAESVDGCRDTTSQTIDLNAYFALPTAYSPNGDGLNDKFRVRGKGIKDVREFKIYNRWGQLVFDASGDRQKGLDGWDGKFNGVQQPTGVYVVYAAITTEYGDEIILKGNLTLLR